MDYLAHYGILGMHWGIRRYQPYPSDYKGSGKEIGEAKRHLREAKAEARSKAKIAKIERKAAEVKAKTELKETKRKAEELDRANKTKNAKKNNDRKSINIDELSIDELKELTSRIRAEKDYYSLINDHKETYFNGKKIVGDVMTTIVTDGGKLFGKYLVSKLLNKMANDTIVNPSDFAKK